jgi:hypothetical protein
MPLPAAIEKFSADVAGELGLGLALEFDAAFDAIDALGDGSTTAVTFLAVAERLAGRRDLPVMTRIEAIDALRHSLDWSR